jgi:rSAM/selenodomain-associated transferase 2
MRHRSEAPSNFIASSEAKVFNCFAVAASPSSALAREQLSRTGCISVIIPVWRETEALISLVNRLQSFPGVREVIISAAEPTHDFGNRVQALGAIFLKNAEPNRGRQLNKGALVATADWLLFHHADTELTFAHVAALAALDPADAIGGAFYRKFDERHPRLRWLEKFERWHSRAFGTLYGDQSIFVRREHFRRIGGFAPIPLMEDVDLSKKLRRSGKIKLLDPPVLSCAQKQIEQGAWRVTLRNLFFLVLFRCGMPVQLLHAWYYSLDRQSPAINQRLVIPSNESAAHAFVNGGEDRQGYSQDVKRGDHSVGER